MANCSFPACSTTPDGAPTAKTTTKGTVVKACGRCKVAAYCGTECQMADWPDHKLWCRAVANGAACSRCQEFPPGTLTLHRDDIPVGPDEMTAVQAALSSYGRSVVSVYHAPFSPAARALVGATAPAAAELNSLNTVFKTKNEVHVGRWRTNFGRERLALTFNRVNESCCVCYAGDGGIMCPDCKSRVCRHCARRLIILDSEDELCPPMFPCPVCRQKVNII
jgi:hypothetical protein